MFGSIYGKAVELFGKTLLVTSFLPLLFVSAALALSIDPATTVGVIREWTAKEPSKQASAAVLLLAVFYLLAFIIFGVRERITRILSAGEFWLLPSIRKWRRVHFTQKELDKEQQLDGPGLAVAQAVTWAGGGFREVAAEYIYIPPRTNVARLRREVDSALQAMQRQGMRQRTSARQRESLARFFVVLHRLAYLDRAAGQERVQRFTALCAAADIDLKAWREDVKALDYGDIVVAYNERVWSPPLRDVQPTELGNILIWAYSYTLKRYGIELDFLYPRLLKVIDKDYQAKIDDRQQFLDFTIILTFLAFVAAGFYALAAAGSIAINAEKHAWQPVVGAVTITALWLMLGRGAYGLSLVAARGYVSIITSAVDLFRLPLLKALEIEIPAKSDETAIWSRMNEAILTGETPAPEKEAPASDNGILNRLYRAVKTITGST